MSDRKKEIQRSRRIKKDSIEKLEETESSTCRACQCCGRTDKHSEKNDLVPFTWLLNGHQNNSSAIGDYGGRWNAADYDNVSHPLYFCSALRQRLEELKREDDRLWDSARTEFLRQQDFVPIEEEDLKAKFDAAYNKLFESGKQMRQDLVRLLRDFSSRKEEMFSNEDDFAKMKAIRRQQEKLMNLHFSLAGDETTLSEQGKALREHVEKSNTRLMEEIEVLSEMTRTYGDEWKKSMDKWVKHVRKTSGSSSPECTDPKST